MLFCVSWDFRIWLPALVFSFSVSKNCSILTMAFTSLCSFAGQISDESQLEDLHLDLFFQHAHPIVWDLVTHPHIRRGVHALETGMHPRALLDQDQSIRHQMAPTGGKFLFPLLLTFMIFFCAVVTRHKSMRYYPNSCGCFKFV